MKLYGVELPYTEKEDAVNDIVYCCDWPGCEFWIGPMTRRTNDSVLTILLFHAEYKHRWVPEVMPPGRDGS